MASPRRLNIDLVTQGEPQLLGSYADADTRPLHQEPWFVTISTSQVDVFNGSNGTKGDAWRPNGARQRVLRLSISLEHLKFEFYSR